MSEHFGNSLSLSIELYSARFFPNPKNMEVNKKKHKKLSLTLLLWMESKYSNNTRAHVSFVSVFDGKTKCTH